jgi:hypothetical protein
MFQDAVGGPGSSSARLSSLERRVDLAVSTCEAGYTAVPTTNDGDDAAPPAAVQVPDPTACILRDGRIGVFPNKDSLSAAAFCESIGLASP